MEQPVLEPGENTVTYLSEEKKISALVYVPEDYQKGEKRPGIVFIRPTSGVKEQTAGVYAGQFSDRGFVTLAFDPRGFGESEGRPQVENPYMIAEDTMNAVSFIRTLSQVNPDQVFSIGICTGAGYATYAAVLDARVKGTAMISPFLNLNEQFLQAAGGSEQIRQTLLARWIEGRQQFFETGEDTFMKAMPETAGEIASALPIQVGMRDYYLPGKPGYTRTWKNAISLYGLESQIGFSVFNVLHLLDTVPFFLAVGTASYTYDNSIEFFTRVNGPKENLVIDGAGHFDLYWKPAYVDQVVDGITAFFAKTAQLKFPVPAHAR